MIRNEKSLLVIVLSLAIVVVATATAAMAQTPSPTLPTLVRQTYSQSPNGVVRTSDCSIYTDRITVLKSIDGVSIEETRALSLGGLVADKIAEAAATPLVLDKGSLFDFSYFTYAFKTLANGTRERVTLGSFDGATGIETSNPSRGATVLREILNANCE
ncbi:MAG: hypothetical protein RBT63_05615 [Bdellovibrionales bacterium]|jgi:hypothetical protein|nr:hypothetical protein [Bdellovibrionales bacterium]